MVIPPAAKPRVRVAGQCIEVSNIQPTVQVGRNDMSLYEPHSVLPLLRTPQWTPDVDTSRPGRAHKTHPDGLSEHDIPEQYPKSEEMKRSNFEAQDKIEHLKFDRTALQARLREQQEAREPLLQDSDIDIDLLEDLCQEKVEPIPCPRQPTLKTDNQPTVQVGRNIISVYEPRSMLPLLRTPPGRAHQTHPDGLSEHDIQEQDGRSQEMQEAREPFLQDSYIATDLLEHFCQQKVEPSPRQPTLNTNNQPTVQVGRNIVSLYEPRTMLPLLRTTPGRAHQTHPDGLSEHDIQEHDVKRSNFEAQDKIEHLEFDRTALQLQTRLREQRKAQELSLEDSYIAVDLLEHLCRQKVEPIRSPRQPLTSSRPTSSRVSSGAGEWIEVSLELENTNNQPTVQVGRNLMSLYEPHSMLPLLRTPPGRAHQMHPDGLSEHDNPKKETKRSNCQWCCLFPSRNRALQRQSRFEATVSKNDPDTLLQRSLAAPDLSLMTAAPRQKKTSLESRMSALGLSRSRTKNLLFPKIRSGDLDLDAEPFARGSSKNVFRARLRKTVPSVGPSGHLVAVLQVWKKKNILDTELEVFAKIGNHPFLTRLVAVMSSDSKDGTVLVRCFVTEFAELGSLDKVLTNLSEKMEKARVEVLLRAALQVLEGMVWLEKKKILHRDLALRNLLVFSFDAQDPDKVLVKITDYGLACFDNTDAIPTISSSPTSPESNEDGMMRRIRWMSPEAILWSTWTEKSDVWAFGVVLWELFTHGNLPYSSLYTQCDLEVGKLVVAGHRLSRPLSPAECPLGIFVVMQKCWQEQVQHRPTVAEVKSLIEDQFLHELI